MDPNRALEEFDAALRELEADASNDTAREQAVSAARNLADWLEKRGFPPALGPREKGSQGVPRPASPWDYAWSAVCECCGQPDGICQNCGTRHIPRVNGSCESCHVT